MDKPKCRLCGAKHYATEAHMLDNAKPKRSRVTPSRPVTESRSTNDKQIVTASRHCPTCTCQERKIYHSNADKQRAYRERKLTALG